MTPAHLASPQARELQASIGRSGPMLQCPQSSPPERCSCCTQPETDSAIRLKLSLRVDSLRLTGWLPNCCTLRRVTEDSRDEGLRRPPLPAGRGGARQDRRGADREPGGELGDLAGARTPARRRSRPRRPRWAPSAFPSAADVERVTRRLRSVSQRLEGIEDAIDRLEERALGARPRLAERSAEEPLEGRLEEIARDLAAAARRGRRRRASGSARAGAPDRHRVAPTAPAQARATSPSHPELLESSGSMRTRASSAPSRSVTPSTHRRRDVAQLRRAGRGSPPPSRPRTPRARASARCGPRAGRRRGPWTPR